jgi:glycosyltransferase involved in cell wall biosynthesis
VVPVYRQWHLVPDLLAALHAQRFDPALFEILLVNNDEGLPPDLPAGPRVLGCPQPGAYAARNVGAVAAKGRWLVFTDADCQPEPDWLPALAKATEAGATDLLAGPIRVTSAAACPNACEIYEMVRGIPQARYVAHGYAATANLAVPAAVFRALGGFEPGRFSGGDAVFCRRARQAGHPLRLVSGAIVAHPARRDWSALAAKARRIKGGQIAIGPFRRRLAWTLRSLVPPLRESTLFLAARRPVSQRLIAVALRFRLWGVELVETARLLTGKPPERG